MQKARPISHVIVGPPSRKALELVELVGDEPPQTPVLHHHVLGAARAAAAFTGEDGAAGLI